MTGPDLARLDIGSRGSMGVVTTAVLRVHRQPEHEAVLGYVLPDSASAIEAARTCLVRGVTPERLRVLSAGQAARELGEAKPPLPAALLAVLTGPAAKVAVEQRLIEETQAHLGGRALSHAVANRWWARDSVFTEAVEPQPRPVAVAVRHSGLADALAALPRRVRRKEVLWWAEGFTLQGVTLWFALDGVTGEPAALRSALLDAGLEPHRLNFPPLLDELMRQLDPQGTLVVMEA